MPQEKNILVNRGRPRTPSSSSGFGFSAGGVSNPDHSDRGYDLMDSATDWLIDNNAYTEELFNENIKNIIHITDAELAKTRAAVAAVVPPGTDALDIELRTLELQLFKARTDHQEQIGIANLYYGHDPLTHKGENPAYKGFDVPPGRRGGQRGYYRAVEKWNISYAAAHEAKFLAEQIKLLDARLATQNKAIADANAKAAAAAQARAQAEAKRVAEEQSRKAAEAKRVAAEEARKAKKAKEREEIAAKERAEADAQLKELYAFIAAMDAVRANRPFPVSGSAVAAGPVFTLAMGRLATHPATTQALRGALQSAVAAVIAAGTASAGAVMVGFAALLFPSPLGNSDRYEMSIPPISDLTPDNLHHWSLTLSTFEPDDLHALSIPLSDLMADDPRDLYAIAEANGDIELPVAMGSRTVGNTTEFYVAATHGTTVPSKVPVRLATLDPTLNVYRSYNPDAPSIGMTWTPIVKPNNASTSLPASEQNVVVYDGTTVTALEGRIDTFPELDLYSFGGFITVFPADSGMPPVYTMFRDRRNEPGVASGYGETVSGIWLETASKGNGAVISNRIADKLRGQHFSNFRSFREEFWRVAIDDPEWAPQFNTNNFNEMKNGRAPFTRKNDRLGGKVKFELHHVNHISEGGDVYDIDNIRVITPKRHSELHKGENKNEQN
ncbi:S-type pyocin domain-containing protein [Pseudomonas sp. TH35]|nr:S-type pyocin domain-containing protein [Pseudomonas sp. TH71]MBK5371472.1 S-type pyocin domain-containing protein [Pseudomonas sp. TH40]MBK5382641.1 S-type pyocin domain-containing protein [Pseudomonas sp. TH35]MBK5388100.1 S-type pyocin domain-containing protein [Pseudomonas sp. TH38]MBK5405395.1 S-type pyocin domain-containing protein [Pseudomonas sp. TH37]MBK5467493.1 S-type pyocin domain-containing protein [Pseudomonas sp. TH20]MBK5523772.1 S-type pyocin domain-containing protein [Pse